MVLMVAEELPAITFSKLHALLHLVRFDFGGVAVPADHNVVPPELQSKVLQGAKLDFQSSSRHPQS